MYRFLCYMFQWETIFKGNIKCGLCRWMVTKAGLTVLKIKGLVTKFNGQSWRGWCQKSDLEIIILYLLNIFFQMCFTIMLLTEEASFEKLRDCRFWRNIDELFHSFLLRIFDATCLSCSYTNGCDKYFSLCCVFFGGQLDLEFKKIDNQDDSNFQNSEWLLSKAYLSRITCFFPKAMCITSTLLYILWWMSLPLLIPCRRREMLTG